MIEVKVSNTTIANPTVNNGREVGFHWEHNSIVSAIIINENDNGKLSVSVTVSKYFRRVD